MGFILSVKIERFLKRGVLLVVKLSLGFHAMKRLKGLIGKKGRGGLYGFRNAFFHAHKA